ncbi:carbohydrate ABC transporter permease [Paenibacillus humicola]|uniref:carbohydrate ABC transporter permease n=1 Tax=Paenibacillus humicola TaxID=3110540 RepID=UPI00237A501A|nr:carbohydrate ABC transporter permease [Paenibacillus humicola]
MVQKRFSLFDVLNGIILILISVCVIFPFLYVFSVSFTDPDSYVPLKLYLFPDKWSLSTYKYLLSTNSFIDCFKSTAFITIVGTLFNLAVTFTLAYGISKKNVAGRPLILGFIVFTLVFNAGILPNYLLVKELGLLNSYWSLIWPSLTNAWSLLVVKSFIEALPGELEEAARIDGCNDLGVFFRIIVPLSMPAIAAFTLFFAVSHWNTYFNALIYLSDSKKWTLQVLLKTLVIDSDSSGQSDDVMVPQETIKMASIILVMAPILVVYPFLQKYFAKGVLIGSVKG